MSERLGKNGASPAHIVDHVRSSADLVSILSRPPAKLCVRQQLCKAGAGNPGQPVQSWARWSCRTAGCGSCAPSLVSANAGRLLEVRHSAGQGPPPHHSEKVHRSPKLRQLRRPSLAEPPITQARGVAAAVFDASPAMPDVPRSATRAPLWHQGTSASNTGNASRHPMLSWPIFEDGHSLGRKGTLSNVLGWKDWRIACCKCSSFSR